MDTEELLRQWGIWAFEDRKLVLGYGPNILAPISSKESAAIDDDVAMGVEMVLNKMKKYKPECYEAMTLHYLGMPPSAVQQQLGISKAKLYDLLRTGRAWFEGFVVGIESA